MNTNELLVFIILYPAFYISLGYILIHLSKTSSGYLWFMRIAFIGYPLGAYKVLPGRDGTVIGINDYPLFVYVLAVFFAVLLVIFSVKIDNRMEKIEQNKIH